MTWLRPWLKYATYDEIKAEAKSRGMFPGTIAPAIIYGEIGWRELQALLPYEYTYDGQEYYTIGMLRDEKYKLTSLAEIKRFLSWNLVNKDNYIIDGYDCDNFAISLMADCIRWSPVCFGLIDVPGHAKNVFVTADKRVYTVEPQTDGISGLPSIVTLYLI